MLARVPHATSLLPPLRGRVQEGAVLGPSTWFRVGGAAELLVRPADVGDLQDALRALPLDWPVTILGAASNVIIRDGGVRGLVIRLGRGFSDIVPEGDGIVAGAACLDATVAEHAADAGLAGLEFLCGIPGSIGGAIAMNAGAYGGDMAQCLDWAEVVLRDGALVRLGAEALRFTYRHAALPAESVVVRVRLRARPGDAPQLQACMAEIRRNREAPQPVRARPGGSTFRNPPDMKAWELIEAAGCRGLTRGGAQVSEKHCNFLLNTGTATAEDLEGLGEDLRRQVQAGSGVELTWEIRRLGVRTTMVVS